MDISMEEVNEVKSIMVRYLARSGYGKYQIPSAEEISQSEKNYSEMGFYDLFEEFVSEVEYDAERGAY